MATDFNYQTKNDLVDAANRTAKSAQSQYEHSTYLYFLARYLVILYEVKFAALPMQVWNEYRNALDHHFRSVTTTDAPAMASHIRKMEGHLHRAVLDVCKLFCRHYSEALEKTYQALNSDTVRFVDNGKFEDEYLRSMRGAQSLFVHAKAQDLALGDGANGDKDILNLYLDSVYKLLTTEELLDAKIHDISKATLLIKGLQDKGSVHHIRDSLIAKGIWSFVLFVLGLIVAKFFL